MLKKDTMPNQMLRQSEISVRPFNPRLSIALDVLILRIEATTNPWTRCILQLWKAVLEYRAMGRAV